MKRRIKIHLPTLIFGFFLSFKAVASPLSPIIVLEEEGIEGNRWSFIASSGYSEYQTMFRHDGRSAIGRFAIAAELLATTQSSFGLELGVQNGKHMRWAIPQGTFDVLGGAVRTTVMPMLDFLITANSNPVTESLLFTQLKGGIAYRNWHIDNYLINNKSELSGEVQAGFGYPLTEITSLNLLYQGVFGANPKLHANSLTDIWHLTNIPVQHGLLIGFSIIV